MATGLIVVDVQNDYFTGGSMELVEMDAAAANCARLLDFFRHQQAPVFHMQHIATREGSTFFVADTPGCEIHDSVNRGLTNRSSSSITPVLFVKPILLKG